MTSSPDPVLTTLSSYEVGAVAYAARSGDRSALARLHIRFAELLGLQGLVLDLGCGPAHDGAELARRGLTAFAADPTVGLLKSGGHREVAGRLVVADARALPFLASSFDGIWACASLLHLPKREVVAALSEARRVLKPCGFAIHFDAARGWRDGAIRSW